MIDLENNTVSLDFFHKILKEIRNRPERAKSLFDSFSKDQFTSKSKILKLIDRLNLNRESEIVIFGCWYGSVIIPVLVNKFEKILGIDLNSDVIKCAKHNLFKSEKNVSFINGDVFAPYIFNYDSTDLVINTSCEHMSPMKEWPCWHQFKPNSYFAFQSNNMYQIEGHINCVNSIDEFKLQLPSSFKVMFEDEFKDERGTRYSLVGKIC